MSGRYGIHDSRLPDRVIMVLIAIWPVQKSENAVHLTCNKDLETKQILREKWRPAGMGLEGSKFRDFSVLPGHMACMNLLIMNYLPTCTSRPAVEHLYFLETNMTHFTCFQARCTGVLAAVLQCRYCQCVTPVPSDVL